MALDVRIYFNSKIYCLKNFEREREKREGEIDDNLIFITSENHSLTLKF